MFKDRYDAAEQLVPPLEQYKSDPNAIILAIPRGGLELGYVLAQKLDLPLDVIFSKKIGLPANPEMAIGAVSETDVIVNSPFNQMRELENYIEEQTKTIRATIKERNATYREGMQPLDLKNKIAIVVDDGVATGTTLLSTIALIKQADPKKIIVALPVAPPDTLEKIEQQADEVVCLSTPELFQSVGQFYQKFNQVDDQEAIRLLREANA